VSHDTTDNTVEAPAVEVVLFEDRARVRREAAVTLVPGAQTIRLSGAGLAVDDSSLAVSIEGARGEIELLSWRVARQVRVAHAADEARRCRDACDAAERAFQAARFAVNRNGVQRLLLVEAEDSLIAQVSKLDEAAIDGWADALDGLDGPMRRWLDADAQLRAALEDRERELERARARHAASLVERREIEATFEIQLRSDAACAITLIVEYVTPCAAWRPAHRAELVVDGAGQATLTMTRIATVWQATGERWERVRCAFSTARPTQAAAPPRLTDDRLYTRPKTEQERRVVEVEARDVTIQLTGAVDGGRKADAMPGVDDGGEPLRFAPSRLVTIPSDGKPLRVELDTTALPCKVELVAFPELAAVAHIRALATWTGQTPLLAGPVTLRRSGEVVGNAKLKFVGAGEAFELGFGPDDALRVRRSVTQRADVRGLTRRNYLEREVALYVSNLSGQDRELILIERVPVSEIEDVAVKLDAHNPADPDKDGFIRIRQTLPARRTATSTVKYTVDYGSNVNLRF
jgi:uncharacterized protein (TIGR02231 family)